LSIAGKGAIFPAFISTSALTFNGIWLMRLTTRRLRTSQLQGG